MQHLVIDYVLDGDGAQRGYNFVTPTKHISPAVRKTVWRQAMPRGQGWGERLYIGARSLKCIPLANGKVALSAIKVTGKRDEIGRQGLRRAEITIMQNDEFEAFMLDRWESYPPDVRRAAESKIGLGLWARITKAAIPKVKGKAQIILAHPYTSADDWQPVEAIMVKIVTARRVRLLKGWGQVNPFTTLALDHHEESRLVAMPLTVAQQVKQTNGVTVIDIS